MPMLQYYSAKSLFAFSALPEKKLLQFSYGNCYSFRSKTVAVLLQVLSTSEAFITNTWKDLCFCPTQSAHFKFYWCLLNYSLKGLHLSAQGY